MHGKMYFLVKCHPWTLEKLTNKLAEADVTKRVCGTLASPANKGYFLDRVLATTASQLSSWSGPTAAVWSTTAWKWMACAINYLMTITSK